MARRSLGNAFSLLGMLALYHGSAFAAADLPQDFIGQVPEPATLTLLGSGLAALAAIAWFRRRR